MRPKHHVTTVADRINDLVASPWAPLVAVALIAIWIAVGPRLPVPEDRHGSVNLGIGIVTLLLVFVIEHHEARNTRALQIKLDEILATLDADSRKVGVEALPQEDLRELQERERERLRAG
jgi:low affinity Fe/Cu permease